MILRKFYIRQDQDQALAELPGNKAEHVRAALDKYLPEKKKEVLNVSESSSSKKVIRQFDLWTNTIEEAKTYKFPQEKKLKNEGYRLLDENIVFEGNRQCYHKMTRYIKEGGGELNGRSIDVPSAEEE